MVKFKVISNEKGLTITISEGRKELEKALRDKQFPIHFRSLLRISKITINTLAKFDILFL